MQRVLDITEREVVQQTLPTEQIVTCLSFNQYAGYLVHENSLQKVTVASEEKPD
jgi:hypothetical protein